ncbi:esterase-like activity of phytase family protein, partial [Chamaesiphon sp. OTE_20_metabat_361]|uniref:esterase-like activity of phytase family protein n=1 Tax=Chamaesiphon sp. OTE_20_metabat_361 TaxID=2964689 RepID=UPI00286D50BA
KGDPKKELEQFINLGVDAFFTDFPGTGDLVRDKFVGTPAVANLDGSRGFEGMAISPDKSTLYPLLEGTVFGDPAGSLRIYEFDVASQKYKGQLGFYKMEAVGNAIGDMTVINNNEYLVIERDGGQGDLAKFKKVYKVDLSKKDANGNVAKEEVADLLNIPDPQDLNKDGSTTYRMPFVTIENLLLIDANTILVANDNNYPFSIGRPPGIDNTEIVQITLNKPLNIDPRVGLSAAPVPAPTLVSGTSGNDTLLAGVTPGFSGFNTSVFAGSGNDTVDVPIGGVNTGFNRIDAGSGADTIYVGNNDRVFGSAGDDIFEANDAKDYRISGGDGNDTLFLGTNGRALGGNGTDKFFVGAGGGNVLSGGASADQFWIYNGEAPASANTIVDYQIGTDVLGITGGVKFTDLIRTGNNIAIGGNTIATLTGVETNTLTAANFAFI